MLTFFLQRFLNFVLWIFCSSCKFEIPVHCAVSKIHFQTVTTK